MIDHRHQCIFIEIPKTGSTSIRQLLSATEKKAHMNICQVRYEMQNYWTHYGGLYNHWMAALYMLLPQERREQRGSEQFERYFKFGFVRNPWDRVVSLYLRRQGLQMRDSMSFDEFVDWIRYSSSTCVHPVPHRSQLDWLVDPHGNELVDFIGRFESLEADWEEIAARLGLPSRLPHVNANPEQRPHYSEFYTPRSRDVIAGKFAVDIEYFGYAFEG